MKSLSVEDAYQWAQRFAAREWRLLVPVALAFMALPVLVLELPPLKGLEAAFAAAVQTQNIAQASLYLRWLVPLMVLIFAVGAFGGLAVTAIALVPGISVGEALALAARRIGILIASVAIVLLGEFAIGILLMLVLTVARFGPVAAQSMTSLFLIVLCIFAGVRLFPLAPMIVRRRIGPISALRETWLLTQGAFWRVFAAAAIYMVGAMVVMLALSAGVGSIFLMLGKVAGANELAGAANAVFQQTVGALLALGFHLVAAAIFRQLDGPSRGI